MISHTRRPVGTRLPVSAAAGSPRTPKGAQARSLARCYLRYVSALWRGDPTATRFATWIDSFWTIDLPPAPADVPDAISPHGGAGHGISWFECDNEILGYVNGVGTGYRVPIAAVSGATPLATTDPCWRAHGIPPTTPERTKSVSR